MPFGAVTSSEVTPVSGAIVASISAAGDKILYSGVLAGRASLASRITSGAGIGVDAAGNAYVAGNTNTTDLLDNVRRHLANRLRRIRGQS